MAFEVPRTSEVYEIIDKVTYYDITWSANEAGYREEGDAGSEPCKPPPHAGFGGPPQHSEIQYSMPTAYLGSQAPYPEPVIAVEFTLIGISVSSGWSWNCSCGGGCSIGENRRECFIEPSTLDEDGNPCEVTLVDRGLHHHEFNLNELPVGTSPDLTMQIAMFGVHAYGTNCYIFGWARKTPATPPDPPFDPPPEIDFPMTPPCLPGVPPGIVSAGSHRRGRVRLCEDCP